MFTGSEVHRRWIALVGINVLCSIVSSVICAEDAVGDLEIAATVNGEPIYVSEVQRELRTALGERKIADSALPYFQAKALAQLVDRRLIVHWLRAQKHGAAKAEIDLEISRLRKQLRSRDITLQRHLESLQITESEMRGLLEWQISWRKFLSRYMTEENLEKYFNDHRREFDGTRMRVAHILFKLDDDDTEEEQLAIQNAAEIRESILKGEISFEEAAKVHSIAPTSDKGGDIGFIQRNKPMHETFSRVAFELKKDEISQPVVTPFGVHLIRCHAIETGQRRWRDAREQLTTAVTRYLFNWAAEKERSKAEIEFTDVIPHLEPGTGELAEE
ncbi:MAG: peptidylprolyl isomerase [Planctomycetes bacterium]|nr:peptidylprolyl isomerase [Planctomycetota bacterium]